MQKLYTPVLFLLLLTAFGPGRLQAHRGAQPAVYTQKLQQASLLFTENRGQVADSKGALRPDILFTAHSGGAKVYLTATGIHYQFEKTTFPEGYEQDEKHVKDHAKQDALRQQIKTETYRFTLSLEGANAHPKIRKEAQNAYTENFYLAHCPDGITGVHTYGRVVMEDVYPGIDWVIYSNKKGLKYDFIVHPGADPSLIKLKVTDADGVDIAKDGALMMKTSLGTVTEAPPASVAGGRAVATAFKKNADGSIGFALGSRDGKETLTIDPSVSWATYYGGSSTDYGYSCATDASGNVYLAGYTTSSSAIASGGYQNTYGGNDDAFLVKFSSTGSRSWATYYGGSSDEIGYSCATDASGNVYLAGWTSSSSAIASGGYQNTYGGSNDAFLVKFSSTGSRTWATYYGGSASEEGHSCATDASGNVYLAGYSASSSAIASGGYQNTYGGSNDAFLVKFSSTGSRTWATYYGGSGQEDGQSCAADASGNVYLAGPTASSSAIASGGYQNTYGGSNDAFLAKFSSAGSLSWATYYGGSGNEIGYSCAADASGNVYLAGYTSSSSAIASGGFQNTYGGSNDAFLVKFSSTGSRTWATYYGGSGSDFGFSCATDAPGNVYLAGWTNSSSAIASGGFQNTYGGGSYDAFLARFSSTGSLGWASYFGGSNTDEGWSCATDASGKVYLAGLTNSSSGIASGGFQNTLGGTYDAFLTKILPVDLQGPAGISPGIQLWLKGDSVSYPGANPVNTTAISTWKDVSGNGNNATVLSGQGTPIMNGAAINGKDVVKFTRDSQSHGTVYEVANIDIRSSKMPKMTVFTVYKQGAKSGNEWHGIWGDDNLNWDRFFMSSFGTNYGGPDDGIVSVGLPTANVQVPGAGVTGTTKLLTAVYDSGVVNGSTIYFNALPVQTVTDNTDPTNAQSDLRIGWDGDDNPFNGDIAEMIVYNRKLTDCEIRAVNRYLGYKYGVTLSTATISPSPAFFCAGGSVTLTGNGTAGSTYTWLRGGALIGGATASTYSAAIAGNYQVIATAGGCSDTSAITVVKSVPNPIYVDGSVATSGTGGSWGTAVKTLTEALDMANGTTCAEEIWVKAGIYYPTTSAGTATTSRDSSFRILRNNIKVYGGFFGNEVARSGRNVAANLTTLSGDIGTAADSTDNCYHVMTIVGNAANNIDTTTVVDGFTITKGNANGGGLPTVNGMGVYQSAGGGINTAGKNGGSKSSPLLENLTFYRNSATYGGGLYGQGHDSGKSSPVVRSCTFLQNRAYSQGGGAHFYSNGLGGNVSPSFSSCTFRYNYALYEGGAGWFSGDGPTGNQAVSSPSFRSCMLDSNYTDTASVSSGAYYGGGLDFRGNSSAPAVSKCVFTNNSSNYGGALSSVYLQNLTVDSCTFTGNKARLYHGGASLFQNAGITYTNCVFTANKAAGNGGAIDQIGNGALSITNCDFTADTAAYGAAIGNYTSANTTVTTSRFISNYGSVVGAIDKNSAGAIDFDRCVFSGNKTTQVGGALNLYIGTASFTNCVLTGNSTVTGTGVGGGAVHVQSGTSINFYNTTLYNNTTASASVPNGNALSVDASSTVNVYNSIIWGAAANQVGGGSTPTFSYSDIKGVAASGTNLSVDPSFANPADPDGADNVWANADDGLRLAGCSPLIDAGSNALIPSLTTDITGGPRKVPSITDIGAYEASTTSSSIVYVDGSIGTSGSGTSWASPFKTVTEALTYVNTIPCANEVWVKAGTYYPTTAAGAATTSRDSSFRILRNGIRMYGGFSSSALTLATSNPGLYPTILSGDIGIANDSSDNIYNVVTISAIPVSAADTVHSRIDGFTIIRGNGDQNFATTTLLQPYNQAGGVLLRATAGNTTNADVYNCVFKGNFGVYGGGLCAYASSAGAKTGLGVYNCVFESNRSYYGGGIGEVAIFAGSGKTDMQNCAFFNNTGTSGYGTAIAAVSQNTGSTLSTSVNNSTFYAQPQPVIYNLLTGGTSTIDVTNSIIRNSGAAYSSIATGSNVSFSYCDLHLASPGTTNINADPLFANATDPDGTDNIWGTTDDGLKLTACSPVINQGSNSYIPASITTDLAGATRIQQTTVDMGAYESPYTYNPAPVISGTTSVNPTTCAGTNGSISLTGLVAAVTYTVNYSLGGAAQTPVSLTANGSGIVTIPGLGAGSYSNFTVTNSTPCTSPIFAGPVTLAAPASPVISGTASTNPTTCGGNDGTISLTGLTASATYTVNYSKGGTPQAAVSLTANGSGAVTITGLGAGSYSAFTVTNAASCTSPAFAGPVVLTPPAAPAISSVTTVNPTTCGGTNGSFTINGLTASTSYAVSYFNGTSTVNLSGQMSNGSGQITVGSLPAGSYSSISVILSGCTGAYGGTVTLNAPSAPAISSATGANPTTCGGTNGSITLAGLTASNVYTVNYSLGGTAQSPLSLTANASGNVVITGLAAGSYSNFKVTFAGCVSNTVAGPVVLSPPAAPVISSVTPVNPLTCGGTTGSITLNGLAPSTTYTVTYFNGTSTVTLNSQTSTAAGTITIPNLGAGTYSSITAILAGCSGTYGSAVTLSSPLAPAAPTASSNSPVCAGGTLSLNASTIAGATYQWSGPNGFSSASQGPSITNVSLAAGGTYSVTATVAGCTSTAGTTPVTINPTPSLTTATGTSPTTCGGVNGSIALGSLTANTSYTINFTKGGAAQAPQTVTTNASGVATITGLGAGIYTAFTATTASSCTSAALGTTVTLANPTAPATPTISSNSPICAGSNLNLNGPTLSGVTYSWSGPNSFSSSLQSPSITAATTAATGTYSLTVTNTTTGCASVPAMLSATVNAVPAISGSSFTNSLTCGGSTGTITLNGLTANGVYTVNYQKNAVAQTGSFTAGATGNLTITGLTAGTYTTISVTQNGCTSNSVTTVTISDPATPAAPVAGSNSPVCQGTPLNLTAAGVTGATYSWTGPIGFTSAVQNPTIASMQFVNAGTYSVTQTVAGCTSAAATTTVVMSTVPAAPGAITGNANPCSNSTYSYYIAPVATATSYTWSLPSGAGGWTGSSTDTLITVTTGTTGGAVSVTANNVCGSSAPTTLATTINNVPAQPTVINGPAAVCFGTTVGYRVPAVANTLNYTWTLPAANWSGTSTTDTITTTIGATSGNLTVTANNVCGSSVPRTLAVTVSTVPGQPGGIAGSATPCISSSQTYAVSPVSGATAYAWTYPAGWTGSSNAASISVNVGGTSGNISVTASNFCGTSPARTLAVSIVPYPTAPGPISGPTSPCAGSAATYSVTAATGATSYAWTLPSGWTGASIDTSISLTSGTSGGTISVTPVNACGNGPSQSLTVTSVPVLTPAVTLAASVSGSTTPTVICAGTPVTFTATPVNGGSAPVYTFKKNGVTVLSSGNTYTDYTLANGDAISVTLSSSLPCVTSNTVTSASVTMTVNPTIVPGVNINSNPPIVLCAGATVTFTTNTTGGGASPTYQWFKNGTAIAGITTPTYTTAVLAEGDTMTVILTTSALCPSAPTALSNKVGVHVIPNVVPTIAVSASPAGPIQPGTTVTFTAAQSGGGATPAYQWKRNGANIPGETGSTYTATNLKAGDLIWVVMQSYAACASPAVVTSNKVEVEMVTTGIVAAGGGWDGALSLYPNPNTGHFTVAAAWSAAHIGKRVAIDIISTLGQRVYHTELVPGSREWSHPVWLNEGIANGTYMLRVATEDGMTAALPFVVNR